MIKKLLSFRSKYSILLSIQKFKPLDYFKEVKIDKDKNQAYIFLAADYGNLGDVAITYAQTKFLKEFSNRQVIEIPISKSLEGLWFVKKNIKKGDIVTTVGGGNMGDLYDQIEYIRQLTIRFFPNNRVISFPQTFDFSETEKGKKALNIAKKVYNSHNDFHIVAREKTSYELMKKHFTNANVLLTPDIVLSLDKSEPRKPRKGVVICMRKDAEKHLTDEQSQFILDEIQKNFEDITYYDTHIHRDNLSIEERETELNKIWEVFKRAELVVTDRLHGMIFCQITASPTMVFQNNNHKVRETHDWIKENKGVHLFTEFDENRIREFLENYTYEEIKTLDLSDKYQPIKKLL